MASSCVSYLCSICGMKLIRIINAASFLNQVFAPFVCRDEMEKHEHNTEKEGLDAVKGNEDTEYEAHDKEKEETDTEKVEREEEDEEAIFSHHDEDLVEDLPAAFTADEVEAVLVQPRVKRVRWQL